ncbi:hypothetical protein [Nonomuraea sp. SYSU D8015]|nr:hypothetical protein [Nonomuraea sp. SYSU D8015]
MPEVGRQGVSSGRAVAWWRVTVARVLPEGRSGWCASAVAGVEV